MFVSLLFLCLIQMIGCSEFSFRDCGSSDDFMKISSIDVKPHPIIYPGDVKISTKYEVLKDVPKEDLTLSMTVDKLTPKRMRIPCINNFGSCAYDYCAEYPKKTNLLLNQFGLGECPFHKGSYTNNQSGLHLPVFNEIFAKVLEGDFESNATYINGKTKQVYACLQVRFTIQLKN